ncbi:MAG: hypothetical protein C4344_02295 [Acidimicrobiia bacterium]
MTMDLPNDEIRRQVREIDREMREVMPRWRSALSQIVAGDSDLTTEQKAAVLGAPTRRGFFKIGGTVLLGAAVLAACGNNNKSKKSAGTTAPEGGTQGSEGGGGSQDLALSRTAASLEILAVNTYKTAIDSGLVKNQAVADAAKLFRDHHQAHADALNGAIRQAGGMEVTEQNKAVFDALVAPAVNKAKSEADIAKLAFDLESAAAQTYTFAGGQLSTPQLRSTIMTIGGIEARHAAILKVVALGAPPPEVFPNGRAFFPGDNPLANIPGAVLSA